jgi:hypothetical protein
MLDQSEMIREMKRVLAMMDANSCTLADSVMELPAALYLNEEYWKREVSELFHKRPVLLALSCEVPTPNSYAALENVPGFRILVTRDREGLRTPSSTRAAIVVRRWPPGISKPRASRALIIPGPTRPTDRWLRCPPSGFSAIAERRISGWHRSVSRNVTE